jgi:predicted enzyme related to lactoylglutathione lyase
MSSSKFGTVGWIDLTVSNASTVRDFYAQVANWDYSEIDMDGYSDYCMLPTGTAEPVAGICHARGENADLPPQWLMYITVPDVAASLLQCTEHGGEILRPTREMGGAKIAVIRDPAGAFCALFQPGDDEAES